MRRFAPFAPRFELALGYKNHRRSEWVESSFDPDRTADRHEFLGVTIDARHITVFFWCITAVFGLFFARVAYLQIIEGQGLALLAERNKEKTEILPAKRGIMYDRNGVVLTHNIPNFVVRVVPSELPSDASVRRAQLDAMARLFGVSAEEIEQRLEEGSRYQPQQIVDALDYDDALRFEVASVGMPGVTMHESQRRSYDRAASSLSHIIGYTGRISEKERVGREREYHLNDTIGKEGLELMYESELRGVPGYRTVEVDALGAEKSVLSEGAPVDGKNLILTLDRQLQIKAEEVLAEWMQKAGKKRGVVIISRPRTGEILAMVSLPSYDNNVFSRGISIFEYRELIDNPDFPLFNRAIYGEYPTGSTVKPIVAAKALDEGVITPRTTILSVGGIAIGQWRFPDWKAGGHGRTNAVKAIAESVNTFFYAIGGGDGDIRGLGIDRLVDGLRSFGLGAKTGIDYPGERSGFVPTPGWKKEKKGEPWYIGDTYHVSIGQGDLLATPLQINHFTEYFANSGISYTPRLVQAVIEPNGLRTPTTPTADRKNVVGPEAVSTVREGMRQTVQAGSAARLRALPVSAAGKTGTAQWGTKKDPHAWFTGWAPYENPEVAITVLVEEGEEGSTIASPVAFDILKWYFEGRAQGSKESTAP